MKPEREAATRRVRGSGTAAPWPRHKDRQIDAKSSSQMFDDVATNAGAARAAPLSPVLNLKINVSAPPYGSGPIDSLVAKSCRSLFSVPEMVKTVQD